MRRMVGVVALTLLLSLAAGCGLRLGAHPTAANPGSGPPPAGKPAASQPANLPPTAAPTSMISAKPPTAPSPGAVLREAISAKEAFAVADPKARSANPGYQIHKIEGCVTTVMGSSGAGAKDTFVVEGKCVMWRLEYRRPAKEGSYEGYYTMEIYAAPNGVMKTEEKSFLQQAYAKPKGLPANWKVDSTQILALVEKEGGRAIREQDPKWDPGRFESDRNAIALVTLEFSPYFDVDTSSKQNKATDIAGSKSVVWSVKYPPLAKYLWVVDGATGELLLKR